MTCKYASFVHLTSNYYENLYFKDNPPFFFASSKWSHNILNYVNSCYVPINYALQDNK